MCVSVRVRVRCSRSRFMIFEERDRSRPCPEIRPGEDVKIGIRVGRSRHAVERCWAVLDTVEEGGDLIVKVGNVLQCIDLPLGTLVRVRESNVLEVATRADEDAFANAVRQAYHAGSRDPLRAAGRQWREQRLASGVAVPPSPGTVPFMGREVL